MATVNIYAIRDIKVDAFNKPFFLQNRAVLERVLHDAVNDENNTVSMHPEDYQVFYLGTFDDSTGKIESVPAEHLMNLTEIEVK